MKKEKREKIDAEEMAGPDHTVDIVTLASVCVGLLWFGFHMGIF